MKELTTYEKEFDLALKNNKIEFYDYISYKKNIGWIKDNKTSTWIKPQNIKSAFYNANFIQQLPNKYFLGISIKELIKSELSNGFCYMIVLALSLCYDDFKIVTCELKNYKEYYKQYIDNDCSKFEHCFLILDLNNTQKIVDTSWGIVTDLETYNKIMGLSNVKILTKQEIYSTELYNFLLDNDQLYNLEKHKELVLDYLLICKKYFNSNNLILQNFISDKLLCSSPETFLYFWFNNVTAERDDIIYPIYNMFSLVDDFKDDFLISRNQKKVKVIK